MPTGWRPEDIKEEYPRPIIEDVYDFKRYNTPSSPTFMAYSLFQLIFTLILLLFMFYNYGEIGFDGLLIYGSFIFLGIYGYTSLMDRAKYAVGIEVFRSLAGMVLIVITGDWFGINGSIAGAAYVVFGYFLITLIGGIYFTFLESKKPVKSHLA